MLRLGVLLASLLARLLETLWAPVLAKQSARQSGTLSDLPLDPQTALPTARLSATQWEQTTVRRWVTSSGSRLEPQSVLMRVRPSVSRLVQLLVQQLGTPWAPHLVQPMARVSERWTDSLRAPTSVKPLVPPLERRWGLPKGRLLEWTLVLRMGWQWAAPSESPWALLSSGSWWVQQWGWTWA